MADKQLSINLSLTADVGQAKQQLQSLQSDLDKIIATGARNSELGLNKDIKDAVASASQLKSILSSSTGQSGLLDLNKFNTNLKNSGKTLQQYANNLIGLGPEGEAAFQKIAKSIMSAEVPLKRTNTALNNFATTMKNVAKYQISTNIYNALIGSLQSAYGYAKDLNESLNNIRIVTGYSSDKMAQFAAEANEAAKALNTTTTAYTDASLIYYQQGLSDQQVKQRTDVTIKMANVARESATEVSSYMTAIWNNFDDGSQSVEHYADVMTKLGATTAASTAEIAAGVEKFASVTRTIGLSYDYATAALATIVDKTRESADVVGNALKTLFSRIEGLKLGDTLDDGTDLNKYSKALAAVGINIKDSNGELKQMDTILDEMGNKWQTLSKDQQMALAQTVAGVRQYTQLVSLMDSYGDFQKNVSTARNADGELQKQADIYAEGWEAASKKVRASMETIYKQLLDDKAFVSLLQQTSKVIDAISKMIDTMGGLKTLIPMIGSLLLKAFSGNIVNSLNSIGQSFSTFGSQIQKNGVVKGAENIVTGQYKIDEADSLRRQAADGLYRSYQDVASNDPDKADFYRQEAANQNKILDLAKAYAAAGKEMSEVDKAELNNHLEIINLIEQEIIKQKEKAAATKAANEAEKENLANKAFKNKRFKGTDSNDRTASGRKTHAEELMSQIDQVNNEAATVNAIKQNVEALSKEKDKTDTIVSSISARIKELVASFNEVNTSTDESEGGMNNLIQRLAALEKQYDDNEIEIDEYIQKLTELQTEMSKVTKGSDKRAAKLATDLGQLTGDQEGANRYNQGSQQGARQRTTNANLKGNKDGQQGQFDQDVRKKQQEITSFSDALMSGAQAAMSFTTAANSVANAIDVIVFDKSASALQKWTAGIMAAVQVLNTMASITKAVDTVQKAMAASTAANAAAEAGRTAVIVTGTGANVGFAASLKAIGAAFQTAMPWVAAFTVAAMALIGIAEAQKKALESAAEEAEEDYRKKQKISQASQEEASAISNAASEYESLFKAYQEGAASKEEMDNATQNLCDTYGLEGGALAKLTGNYEAYGAILDQIAEKKRQAVEQSLTDVTNENAAAEIMMTAKAQLSTDHSAITTGYGVADQYSEAGVAYPYNQSVLSFGKKDVWTKTDSGFEAARKALGQDAVLDEYGVNDFSDEVIGINIDYFKVDSILNTYKKVKNAVAEMQAEAAANGTTNDLANSEIYKGMQEWLAQMDETVSSYSTTLDTMEILKARLGKITTQDGTDDELPVLNVDTTKSVAEYRAWEESVVDACTQAGKSVEETDEIIKILLNEFGNADIAGLKLIKEAVDDIIKQNGNLEESREDIEDLFFAVQNGEGYELEEGLLNFDPAILSMMNWKDTSLTSIDEVIERFKSYQEYINASKATETIKNNKAGAKELSSTMSKKGFEWNEDTIKQAQSLIDWSQVDEVEDWTHFLIMSEEKQQEILQQIMTGGTEATIQSLQAQKSTAQQLLTELEASQQQILDKYDGSEENFADLAEKSALFKKLSDAGENYDTVVQELTEHEKELYKQIKNDIIIEQDGTINTNNDSLNNAAADYEGYISLFSNIEEKQQEIDDLDTEIDLQAILKIKNLHQIKLELANEEFEIGTKLSNEQVEALKEMGFNGDQLKDYIYQLEDGSWEVFQGAEKFNKEVEKLVIESAKVGRDAKVAIATLDLNQQSNNPNAKTFSQVTAMGMAKNAESGGDEQLQYLTELNDIDPTILERLKLSFDEISAQAQQGNYEPLFQALLQIQIASAGAGSEVKATIDNIKELQEVAKNTNIDTTTYNAMGQQYAAQDIGKASSMEDVDAIQSQYANIYNIDIDTNTIQEKLIELGSKYSECAEEVKALQDAIEAEDEAAIASAENALQLSVRTQEAASKYKLGASELERYIRDLQNNAETAKLSAKQMVAVATAYARCERAVKSANKNLKTWEAELKKIAKTGEMSADVLVELADTYGDLLNLDGKKLSNDFLRSEKALKLMDGAIKGSAEDFNELQMLAAQDIKIQFGVDGVDMDEWNAAAAELSSLYDDTLPVGEPIVLGENTEVSPNFTAACDKILSGFAATEAGAAQAEAAFAAMGYDAEVEVKEVPTTTAYIKPATYAPETLPFGLGAGGNFNYPRLLDPADYETVTGTQTVLALKTITPNGAGSGGNIKGGGSPSGRGGGGRRGGGGGRRAERNSASTKNADDEKERYHVINNQLEDLSKNYDAISKAKDRAFGTAKIKLMNQEIKILDNQIKKQKEKTEEVKKYLALDKQRLLNASESSGALYGKGENATAEIDTMGAQEYLGMNVKFDANGTITNYDAIIEAAVARYNASVEEFNEATTDDEDAKKQFDLEQARYDNFIKLIQQYEETQDLMADEAAALLEKENAKYDALLEKTNYIVKIKIDVEDDKLKLLDYYLGKIKDDAFAAADQIALLNNKISSSLTKTEAYQEGVRGIFMNHGLSNEESQSLLTRWIGGDKEAEAAVQAMNLTENEVDTLRDHMQNLLKENTNIMDGYKELYDTIGKYFDAVNNKAERALNKMAHLQKMTNNYEDIIDIVGQDNLGVTSEAMAILRSAQQTQANNITAGKQAELDGAWSMLAQMQKAKQDLINSGTMTPEQQKLMDEQIDHMEDKVMQLQEDVRDALKDSLNLLKDNFSKTLQQAARDFSKNMAGIAGNLQGLEFSMNLKKEEDENYLPEYERVYELTKLTRDIEKSIDNTSNVKAKRELAALEDEILQAREEGKELSEYDIEYMRKRYELKLAEMTLDESKNTKSQVRMQRDSEGNYGYVYTADESAVEDAQQNYEDKLYEMQKMNADYINTLQDSMLQLMMEQEQKIAELADIYEIGSEEYNAALEELQAHYANQMDYYNQQMDNVLGNNKILYEEEVQAHAAATGNRAMADEQYLEKFGQLPLAMQTGYKTAEQFQNNWTTASTRLYDVVGEAAENFKNDVEAAMNAAGLSMSDFRTDVDTNSSPVLDNIQEMTEETETLRDALQDLADDTNEAFEELVRNMEDWVTKYKNEVQDMILKNENLAKSIQTAIEAWSQYDGMPGGEGELEDEEPEGDGEGENIGTSSNIPDEGLTTETAYGIASAIWMEGRLKSGWGATKGSSWTKRVKEKFGDEGVAAVLSQINAHGYNGDIYREWSKNRAGLEQFFYDKFDTGGYTGEWGNDGRLAMLHQKELVLNATDTENLLNAVDLVRQIAQAIDLNANAMSGGLGAMFAATVKDNNQTIEQQVTITAEFPNATDRNEILSAFDNIINLASQYANRK